MKMFGDLDKDWREDSGQCTPNSGNRKTKRLTRYKNKYYLKNLITLVIISHGSKEHRVS